jgi:hypothetical protein
MMTLLALFSKKKQCCQESHLCLPRISHTTLVILSLFLQSHGRMKALTANLLSPYHRRKGFLSIPCGCFDSNFFSMFLYVVSVPVPVSDILAAKVCESHSFF